MHKFEDIPYPSEKEKKHSIQRILNCGMPEPQRLAVSLPKLYKAIGLKGIFFGVEDCIFLSILIGALGYVCLFSTAAINPSTLFLLLFFISPFLYELLHLLTIWKEIMNDTFELKMTCRYTLRQMTVLRMLVFGGISVVATVIASSVLQIAFLQNVSLLRLLSISFSALFLFALAQLLSELKWNSPKSYLLIPTIWCMLSLCLFSIGEKAEQLFLLIPTAVFWLISICAAALYGYSLKQYYFKHKEGVITHAFS